MKGKILLTGAAGQIGEVLRPALVREALGLISADVAPLTPIAANERCLRLDVRDAAAVEAAMAGVDVVFHFAGIASEADWPSIHAVNIDGTYNVYEAARRAGTRRVVFASSNHFAGFHRRDRRTGSDIAPRPDSRYGVSKVAGEAIGRLYADKHGVETIALRIGQCRPKPTHRRALSLWLSHGDMARLAVCCLAATNIHFDIVYGVSANTRAWYDNPGAEKIGFRPTDNAEDFAATLPPEALAEDEVASAFQGGPFCSEEFDGVLARID